MAEFKVRKGDSTFSAGDVGALLELARRGLISSVDSVFLPARGVWVRARLLKDLQPFLEQAPEDWAPEPSGFPVQTERRGASPEYPIDEGEIEDLTARPPRAQRSSSLLARLLQPDPLHHDLATPRELPHEEMSRRDVSARDVSAAAVSSLSERSARSEDAGAGSMHQADSLEGTPAIPAEPGPAAGPMRRISVSELPPTPPTPPEPIAGGSRLARTAGGSGRMSAGGSLEGPGHLSRAPAAHGWELAPAPVEAWEPNPHFSLPEAPGLVAASPRPRQAEAEPTRRPSSVPLPGLPTPAGQVRPEPGKPVSEGREAEQSPLAGRPATSGAMLFPVGRGAERDYSARMELSFGSDPEPERVRREPVLLEPPSAPPARVAFTPHEADSQDEDSLWGSAPLVSSALLPLAAPAPKHDLQPPDALAGIFGRPPGRPVIPEPEQPGEPPSGSRPPEHELEIDFPLAQVGRGLTAEQNGGPASEPSLPSKPPPEPVSAGGPRKGSPPNVPDFSPLSAEQEPSVIGGMPSSRPRADRTLSEMEVSVVMPAGRRTTQGEGAGARTAKRTSDGDISRSAERGRRGSDVEPALVPAARLAPGAPPSFQDWVEKRTDSVEGGHAGDKLAAAGVISPLKRSREPQARTVRWGLLLGIALVGLVLFSVIRFSLKSLSQQTFPTLAEEVGRQASGLGPAGVEPPPPATEAEAELVREEARLRTTVRPQLGALKSFDLAQDELFSELVNLKLSVRDVSLEPVDGNRSRSVRTSESDLTIRLRPGRLLLDEQVALAGLVVGKYVLQDRLRIRHLLVQLERREEGRSEPSLVRRISGKDAAAFYNQTMSLQQFRLAVVAGTELP